MENTKCPIIVEHKTTGHIIDIGKISQNFKQMIMSHLDLILIRTTS